jgi:hypothetical protein
MKIGRRGPRPALEARHWLVWLPGEAQPLRLYCSQPFDTYRARALARRYLGRARLPSGTRVVKAPPADLHRE